MMRRIGYMSVTLLLLVVLAGSFSWIGSIQTPIATSTFQQPSGENRTYVPTEQEERILKKVGLVPYITDVAFDETPDGKMIVSATAEIGASPEPDKKGLARKIAHDYTIAVYGSGVPIAEASIHITSDNHLLLGTSLGSDHQKKMGQSAMAGTGAGTAEFFRFLKENETDTTQPEMNTWYYEIP